MASVAPETLEVELHPRTAKCPSPELNECSTMCRQPVISRIDRRASRHVARRMTLAVCFVLSWGRPGYCQGLEASPWFTRVGFTPAYVFETNPFSLSEAPADKQIRSAPSITIEMGRQTDGSRDWHHLYGMPSYGFGVSLASPGNGSQISRPVDAYTFFSWPFARLSERVQVTTDFGMGISWNWKAFNQQTNSYTTVLGSNMNARIDWGFYLRYIMTPQTSLYAGVDYTHRSNGGTRQPDQGINVIGPSVALRYNLGPERRQSAIKEPPPFLPAWEFVIGGAGGLKDVVEKTHPDLRHDFGAFDVTAGLQRHFYRYGKIAAGTDVTYDGATGARVDFLNGVSVQRRAGPAERLSMGLYGGYEHLIGRFSAIVQVGYNVANGSEEPERPRLYERYGWRYQFNDRFFGTMAVRAIKDHKADFVEFGVGYKTRWR
jgi:hypothetical protein